MKILNVEEHLYESKKKKNQEVQIKSHPIFNNYIDHYKENIEDCFCEIEDSGFSVEYEVGAMEGTIADDFDDFALFGSKKDKTAYQISISVNMPNVDYQNLPTDISSQVDLLRKREPILIGLPDKLISAIRRLQSFKLKVLLDANPYSLHVNIVAICENDPYYKDIPLL